MATNVLRYKVEHKADGFAFYSLIAAFDCEPAAIGYAGECAFSNIRDNYRVKVGAKIIQTFGPNT